MCVCSHSDRAVDTSESTEFDEGAFLTACLRMRMPVCTIVLVVYAMYERFMCVCDLSLRYLRLFSSCKRVSTSFL